MAVYQLFVRGAAANVLIPDLGFTVPQGPSWTMLNEELPGDAVGNSGQFNAREIRNSADLKALITAGTLEWSRDGVTAGVGSDYLADFMLMQDFTDDTLDLTSGNLVLPNGNSYPSSGVGGQIFYDVDDETLFVWNPNTLIWDAIATSSGISNDHGMLGGLYDDDHPQYALLAGNLARNTFTGGADFSSTSGLILPTAIDRTGLALVEGNIMFDSDDNQLWLYDGNNWLTLASTLSGLLDHGALTGLLDDDHPQYANLGQDETVSGLWTFNPSATEPSLVLTPHSAPTVANSVDGAVVIIDGVLYTYDGTRGTYLSVDRKMVLASRQGNATHLYLRVGGEGVPTSETGVRMLRDGTIVGIFAQTSSAKTWTFEVRRNGSVIASLSIVAATGSQVTNTNVDFSQGDVLQFFANGTAIPFPVGGCEVAWRVEPV